MVECLLTTDSRRQGLSGAVGKPEFESRPVHFAGIVLPCFAGHYTTVGGRSCPDHQLDWCEGANLESFVGAGRHSMTDYVMDQDNRMKFLEDLEGRKKQLEETLVEAHQDDTPEDAIRRLEGRIEEVRRLAEKLQEDKLYEYFQQ